MGVFSVNVDGSFQITLTVAIVTLY